MIPTFRKQLGRGVTAQQRQGQDGDALRAPPGRCSQTIFLVVHRERCESTLSLMRRPVRAALLGTSLCQDCIAGKTIQRDWDIGADGHESSCSGACAKSCHQSGLIYPSKAGLILPSVARDEGGLAAHLGLREPRCATGAESAMGLYFDLAGTAFRAVRNAHCHKPNRQVRVDLVGLEFAA